ncbi:methyltransferase domain-containing protein [Oryzomonas japonica]|uniref:Methyltransferase domain-containing protein n=1 Tax=Oryzomonas japonica TaxID=2603858 RepID=A0A7J4ZVJ9_9BACT|nr:class I SAM-dependent methyltransferase [Oryzomonas japonica]KAB0667479.1 methyltransferase domain-containing protein [Oryzomonas japonica]
MTSDAPQHIPLLRGPVPLTHLLLRHFVRSGDRAVDATCGNGNDTLLLAELVGPTGRVWGFDIQQEAVDGTARKLAARGLEERVTLVAVGHETMAEQVEAGLSAVVFNLGYLPGGDRSLITRPETTGAALEQALDLLAPGGIVALTVYPGHRGGDAERRLVEEWAGQLPAPLFHAWRMGQTNVTADAPYVICVQKGA